MTPPTETLPRKSRLVALLDHFSQVEDPRDARRILPGAACLIRAETRVDAVVVAIGGLVGLEGGRPLAVEEQPHLLGERQLSLSANR